MKVNIFKTIVGVFFTTSYICVYTYTVRRHWRKTGAFLGISGERVMARCGKGKGNRSSSIIMNAGMFRVSHGRIQRDNVRILYP